jgi:MFS superfamily sulfate permease-like transporter
MQIKQGESAMGNLNLKKYFLSKNLKRDIPSSVVVFLVALPLCLGIALASGAPLFAGVLTGIIGGIVVGYAQRLTVECGRACCRFNSNCT